MLDETLLREAEAFANSQTMAELFKRLKEQAREQWATSKPEAKEAREHLYRMHEALELLEVALNVFGKGKNLDAYNRSLAARNKVG
jgi:hypothetical protein